MYIDFEKFKDRKRDGSPRYIKCCRISEEQKKQLKDIANHNNLNLTEALNCAIDYGCEKMRADEGFKNYVLSIPTKRKNVDGVDKKQKIILKKNTNDKLEMTKNEFRLYNENGFIYAAICAFLEEIK